MKKPIEERQIEKHLKSNIILITIDCLRKDFYKKNSNPNLPFLEKILNVSACYENCFSLALNTNHGIPQLLSSTYPNIMKYNPKIMNSLGRMGPPRVSIAEKLKESGFHTYSFQAKLDLSPLFGFNRGFYLYKFYNPYYRKRFQSLVKKIKLPYLRAKELNRHITNTNFRKPYFLWIHYTDVHEPYYNILFPRYLTNFLWYKYTRNINPKSMISKKIFSFLYAKSVEYVDNMIFQLFEESNSFDFDNSLVIVTADHGQFLGEYNLWGHGGKSVPTKEILNVPLYIKLPRQNDPDLVSISCTLQDIAPTIYDYFNIEPPIETEGESLLKKDRVSREYHIIEGTLKFEEEKFSVMITQGPYIYMRNDWYFKEPRLLKIGKNKLEQVNEPEKMQQFKQQENNHLGYIKHKQKIYSKCYEKFLESQTEIDKKIKEQLRGLSNI